MLFQPNIAVIEASNDHKGIQWSVFKMQCELPLPPPPPQTQAIISIIYMNKQ